MLIKIWGQEIEDDGTHYHVHIKKPIYGHCVAISSKILLEAKLNHRLLIVSCPGASEEISPDGWMWKSKQIHKVYRDVNNPMLLWQGYIGATQPEVRAEQVNQHTQLTLL